MPRVRGINLSTRYGERIMSNKHTNEPWPHFTDIATTMTPDPEGTPVAILSWDDYIRARACVNACAGIDTELLEIIEDNDKTLAGVIANVEKQRDELLAALERFMDSHEECTDFDGFTAQIVSMDDYHQAQEAIASVKEKK